MGTEKGGGEKFYQKPLITARDGAQEREREELSMTAKFVPPRISAIFQGYPGR